MRAFCLDDLRLPARRHALLLAACAGWLSPPAGAQVLQPGPIAPDVDRAIATLQAAPAVRRVLDGVRADHERSLADLKLLTEIAAPPFKEQARAEAFLARMQALGLADARIDGEGNVIGIRRGSGSGPRLLVSAHLDTVFPEGTDVTVKVQDGRWSAPGISDDTRGLSVLLSWLKVLNDNRLQTVGDLVFVGNTGEEELGNLRGIKAVFRDQPDIDGMVGLEPGTGDRLIVQGTGSHRYEVAFRGPGGHSFNAFGLPSAIHALGRAVARIGDVRTPADPKTTFTVGTIGGGTSVNSIAGDARMAIDIRSNDAAALDVAEKAIMAAIAQGVDDENRRWTPQRDGDRISFTTRLIGDRPAGITAPGSRLVQVAVRSTTAFGKPAPGLTGASTDANVPMGLGIPAIIMGSGGKTGGFHARDEWFEPANAWEGAQISLATVLALVGVQDVSAPLLDKRGR